MQRKVKLSYFSYNIKSYFEDIYSEISRTLAEHYVPRFVLSILLWGSVNMEFMRIFFCAEGFMVERVRNRYRKVA